MHTRKRFGHECGGFHLAAHAIFRAPPMAVVLSAAKDPHLSPFPAPRMASDPEPRSGKPVSAPLVGVIMGSRSDLRVMSATVDLLTELGIPHEVRVVSAHRTPDWMFAYARRAESRGLAVIIAAAGGAAHLPGMVAASTILPVLRVPIPATQLNSLDALLSILQMPKAGPGGTPAV